jgi:hypothetical protein
MANNSTSKPTAPSADADKIVAFLVPALQKSGLSQPVAHKYAMLARNMYVYIQNNPDVQRALSGYEIGNKIKSGKDIYEGSIKAYGATRYMNNGAALGLTSAANGFSKIRAGGVGTALTGFIDIFEGYAKNNGIELNECSLAVAKVSLDFVGVMAGTTGIGLVVAGMSVVSVGKDSYMLGQACFTNR